MAKQQLNRLQQKVTCAFLTRLSATQSVSSGVFTPINFGDEQYDVGGNVSGSTFTAPIAGIYQLNWAAQTAGGTHVLTRLVASGGVALRGIWGQDTANVRSSVGSATLKLAAGETVQVEAYIQGDLSIRAGEYTHFSGFLVGVE